MASRTSKLTSVLIVVGAALVSAAPALAAPSDVIRTGGPSAPGDPKVAIVASSKPLAGGRFVVVDARGRKVSGGRLRAASGSPLPWRYAAAADLSGLRRPGSYRVRVGKLTSRPWVVGKGVRRSMLRRLLRVFAVNRDGREPNPVFDPAHLNDAIVAEGPYAGQRFDLTGGWRDAGDNLKFVQTTGMAVAYLTIAARLAPEAGVELAGEAQVGVRWLLKAHPRPGLFLVTVGDERDHEAGGPAAFRDPAMDDKLAAPGVGTRVAYPSAGSNTAGIAAAALALTAQRESGARADGLLAAAREWYAAGKASASPTDVRGDFYEPQDWEDDMALAAVELWRATSESAFLADAVDFVARAAMDSGVDSFSVGPLAAADLCGALGAPAPSDPAARDAGCGGLRTAASAAAERAGRTAFGTPGPSFGSVQDLGGSGAMAAAAERSAGVGGGRRIGAAARDYLLGRNPWGASFVVGRGPGEARNPHHPAYLKGPPARLLDGAVVGGPAMPSNLANSGLPPASGPYARFNSPFAVYEDNREDFVTSEVSLAYSASAILLAASLSGG